MIAASIGAAITGCSMPAFCILFGNMLDALNNGTDLQSTVTDVCVQFVILGAINIFSGFIQVVGWCIAGERQTKKFKESYVKAILSQVCIDMNSIYCSNRKYLFYKYRK